MKLGRNRRAFPLALKAMLVSPDFLYLKEKKSESKRLGPFEIANRLSYFLWSSLPDNELFQMAKENKTDSRASMKEQTERLLSDPRSKSFVRGFADSWLRLDKLGTMPPASLKFREYYRYGLKEAMLEETHRFLGNAIKENVPLTDFIHSDYGFLNQDLARHYGMRGIEGIHFRKVSFPEDSVRGGLLGQASILTLTANGVDTSPVIRGIWVLESLLGTPPSPPPPDVEPIDPDVRGAQTVKDLLQKHRSVRRGLLQNRPLWVSSNILIKWWLSTHLLPVPRKNHANHAAFPWQTDYGSAILTTEKNLGPRSLKALLKKSCSLKTLPNSF